MISDCKAKVAAKVRQADSSGTLRLHASLTLQLFVSGSVFERRQRHRSPVTAEVRSFDGCLLCLTISCADQFCANKAAATKHAVDEL